MMTEETKGTNAGYLKNTMKKRRFTGGVNNQSIKNESPATNRYQQNRAPALGEDHPLDRHNRFPFSRFQRG